MKRMYQERRKLKVSYMFSVTALDRSERIVPPSVLKKRVAIGLYSRSEHLAA